MRSRLLLVAGPGGAGSTSLAARTALECASRGERVALLDLDLYAGACTLVRDAEAGAGAAPDLLGAGVRTGGPGVDLAREVTDLFGLERRLVEEAAQLPGHQLVAALVTIAETVAAQGHDLVVVDAGSRAVELCAAGEQLPWLLSRLLPAQRGWLATVRPVVAMTLGNRWPGERASMATAAARNRILEARDALRAGAAVVVAPSDEELGVGRRTARVRVGLALHDIAEAAVVGRDADTTLVLEAFAATEPARGPMLEPDGEDWLWRTTLPLLRSRDVQVRRTGDDLVVEAAGARRVAALPSSLRRCRASGAVVRDGILEVRFVPDQQEQPT